MLLSEFSTVAFPLGVKDGFNPYALASLLIFLLFLSRTGSTSWRIVCLGIVFILAAIGTNFRIFVGDFDRYLVRSSINNGLHGLTAVLGAFFTCIGLLHFRSWQGLHGLSSDRSPLGRFLFARPVFLKEAIGGEPSSLKNEARRSGRRISGFLLSVIFSSVLATAVVLWGSLWPQSYWVITTYYFLIQGGDLRTGVLFALFYCASSALPLFVCWLVILLTANRHKIRPVSARFLSYWNALVSAAFLSTGIGLMYLFVKG